MATFISAIFLGLPLDIVNNSLVSLIVFLLFLVNAVLEWKVFNVLEHSGVAISIVFHLEMQI